MTAEDRGMKAMMDGLLIAVSSTVFGATIVEDSKWAGLVCLGFAAIGIVIFVCGLLMDPNDTCSPEEAEERWRRDQMRWEREAREDAVRTKGSNQ